MSFLPAANSPQPPVFRLIAGVDEAGRGPLAGPVTAAAVILHPTRRLRGIKDSKQLTPARREELAVEIRAKSLAWAVGWAEVEEIDRINILQATFLAMRRALAALPMIPTHIKIDGNRCPPLLGLGFSCTMEAIIQGDASERSIGAASILAKVDRDAAMRRLDAEFPQYGFAIHKGYGTAAHRDALLRHGPSPVHRRSFAPVRLANMESNFTEEDYVGALEDCFET